MAPVRTLSKSEIDKFDHLPRAMTKRARLKTARWLPPQADAMTLGNTIYVRPGHQDSDRLIAHELVHVRQWAELGRVGFLARYLSSYFRNLARLRNHMAAYRSIPLEEEARAGADTWKAKHR